MAIDTLILQGETFSIIDAAGTSTVYRTQTGTREDASNGGTANSGPGQQYDASGLWRGYIGDGYLDINGGSTGAKATFDFAGEEGTNTYEVTLRIASGSNAARPIALEADGATTDPQGTQTGGWDSWETRTFQITVTGEGPHTVGIVQSTSAGAPNIDAVAVHEVGVVPDFVAPAFTGDVAFTITENATEVGALSAEDADGDAVSYAIAEGGDGALFSIDASTGALSFVEAPDFEAPAGDGSNTYTLTVTATSNGREPVEQLVTVTVEDDATEALAEPEIEQRLAQAEEGAITPAGGSTANRTQTSNPEDPAGKAPGELDEFGLRAGYSGTGYTDFGSNPGDAVIWTVNVPVAGAYDLHVRYATSGTRPLDLVAGDTTAQVEFTGDDFATWTTLEVTVALEAGDNTVSLAIPAGRSNGPNVDAIALTSVGTDPEFFPAENAAPVFDDPVAAVTVDENTTAVHDFGATDADADDTVTYALSGADAGAFAISDAGELSFAEAPDAEAPTDQGGTPGDNVYEVTVSATDGEATTSQDVSVSVADVDETVPNTDPTAAAGQAATDEDAEVVIDLAELIGDAEDGEPAIVEATSAEGEVAIEGTTLRFTPAADFNGPATIAYTVQDQAGATASSTVSVAVAAVDDPASIVVTPVAVQENVEGAVVATIAVSDVDGDTYAAGDLQVDDARFEIVEDGGLKLKLLSGQSLDAEAGQPSVTVSLVGAPEVSAQATLDVQDVDEGGPVAIDFSTATITSYTTSQDGAGQAVVSADGSALQLDGNLWKRVSIGQDYDITANTRIELTLAVGAVTPEIVAVGFDQNESFTDGDGSVYKLAGTQGFAPFKSVSGTPNGDGTSNYVIDLSAHAGKTISTLVFVSDDDQPNNGVGAPTFLNVRLVEAAPDTGGGENAVPRVVGGGVADLAVDEGGAVEVDLPFVDDDGDALSFTLAITDGAGNDVTAGFGLSIEDGVLVGTVADAIAGGDYTVTVTAADGEPDSQATDAFTLTVNDVNEAPVVDPNAAFEPFFGRVGQAIDPIDVSALTAAFSDPDAGDTLTFSVANLPAGLSFEEGVIFGTPTEAGTGAFTVVATDAGGLTAQLSVDLILDAPGVGETTFVEAESFTGLGSATNFFVTGQAGASGDQLIRVNSNQAGSITTELAGKGVTAGWHQVSIDLYDETDGSATFSITVGDTVVAQNVSFDSDGQFLNGDGVSGRGAAGQSGNLKRITLDTPVLIEAGDTVTLTGQADGELLRIDRLGFTRIETPNQAPTAPTLSSSAVSENAAGAVVGALSSSDPDGDDAAIAFAVDDARFEVVDGQLKLKDGEALDFETEPSVAVTVTATDEGGRTTAASFTIAVGDVDEAPGAVTLSSASVDENAPGAVIGTLSASDGDGGAVVGFTTTDPRFVVTNGNELALAPGEALDHEAGETVTVDVLADGAAEATTLTIDVADLNDAPTLTGTLAPASVPTSGGTVDLSALVAADEDEGQTPTLGVRLATGEPGPEGVVVENGALVVPAGLDAGELELEIFATDGELESESVPLTVTVGAPQPFAPVVVQGQDAAITLSASPDGDATVTLHRDENVAEEAEDPGAGKILENGIRAGYSGTGYIDFGDDAGDAAAFTVNVPTAGSYDLNIRYASQDAGGGPRVLDLAINDGAAVTTTFPSTGPGSGPAEQQGFNSWAFLTQTVQLAAGANVITLAMADGTSAGPNVDRIEITEAGTGPIPAADTTADEGGDLAATAPAAVEAGDLGAVEIRLAGVDADITGFEVSLDDGATFQPATFTQDGDDWVTTLDLSGQAGETSVEVVVRVTDGAGNTADTSAVIAVQDEPTGPFAFDLQLEARDGSVTIDDDTGTGEGDPDSTQPRDPQNPESVNPDRPNGLWPGFEGAGYLDMGAQAGDAVEFTVTAPEAGSYAFSFRYINGSDADRPMTLTTGSESATIPFASTGTWTNWTEAEVEIDLAAGPNVIRLANVGSNGPNLDSVTVTAGDTDTGGGQPPVVEPGPRETIAINFQDGEAPKAPGYLVDNFEGYGDRGNGQTYGWVTEASATDADGTANAPIDGSAYPAIAINERTTGEFADYDPRLQGYAHFDLGSYPERTAWEIALENGWYEVTVSVGDTGGPNDSQNRLLVEGELATAWVPTDEFKSQLVTVTAQVTDGHLTLSAPGGTITEMQYVEIRALPDLTPDDDREAPADYASFFDARAISGVGATEKVVDLDPGDGARPEDVDPTADIFLGINVIEGRGGALLESLSDGSVKLYETLTGQEVAINVNTTGGFDSLTISPTQSLKENTSYTLRIDGFQDRGAIGDASTATREFQKFSTSFTTGEAAEIVDRDVAFTDTVELNGAATGTFGLTSIEMSPDGTMLYAVTIGGQIKRWDIDPANGGIVASSEETFTPAGDFVVDPDDAQNGRRGFIGIVFDPEDPETIWVSDNYPIPLTGRDDGVPDFSGRVSKVTLGDGGSLEDASISPYVTGFPRSNGDHVTNSLEFRQDGGQWKLYLVQGSNSAMGEPDSAWGLRPERLLNASIMEIDHKRTDVPEGGFDVTTEPLPADGLNRRFADGDNDLKDDGIAITSGEFSGQWLHFDEDGVASVREGEDASSALVKEFYDPFAADAVVKIFATGQRNAYDLVWHSNGFLYVPTNGSAAGGNTPDDPDTDDRTSARPAWSCRTTTSSAWSRGATTAIPTRCATSTFSTRARRPTASTRARASSPTRTTTTRAATRWASSARPTAWSSTPRTCSARRSRARCCSPSTRAATTSVRCCSAPTARRPTTSSSSGPTARPSSTSTRSTSSRAPTGGSTCSR